MYQDNQKIGVEIINEITQVFANRQNINITNNIPHMSVQVAVRVRPFNERQIFINSSCCVEMQGNKTRVLLDVNNRQFQKKQFTFDYSFWSHDEFQKLENGLLVPMTKKYWDQEKVFNEIGNKILDDAWQGFNCCLFAYGQTGSGKSYSMLGYGPNKGIVPRVCEEIFRRMCACQEDEQNNVLFSVTISMIEIYNQKVQDLLIPSSKRPLGGLEIRENKKMGVYVQGITKHNVNSYKAIERWMEEGSKNRSLASTLMNQYSSRAHTIISIQFIQRVEVAKNQVTQKNSTIHLIDLAGSQRVSKTGLSSSDRLKEAGNINKSLHHLGLVIEILADKSIGKRKNEVVPYRSSCLTRILQNSLGGNAKTIMICALSPAFDNYEQTLSTLRYADQVKKIKNNATINESMTDKLIRELRQQNQRLRLMIKELNDRTTISPQDENVLKDAKQYQKQIMKMIGKNQEAMKSFAQIHEQENLLGDDISQLDLEKLQQESQSQQLSIFDCFKSNQPYITNLNEDQMLNGKVKYNIESQLLIGRKNGNPIPHVVLGALGIQPNHAKIYKRENKIYISTYSEQSGDYTYLNGDNVYESMELYHNDRIIFGTSCVFVVKIPNNTEPRQSNLREQELSYQFAIAELQSVEKNKSMTNDEELIIRLQAIEEEAQMQKERMHIKLKQQRQKHQQEIQRIQMIKQREHELMMKQLEKQQIFQANLLMQRQEKEEQKRRTRELEELLEKERKINEDLEQAVQHSSKVESDLRESLQNKLAQMQIQRLKKQKQLIQQGLRKKQEEQKIQKERLQEQLQKIHEISRQRAEQEANLTQEILRQNLIMAQNQNILNERFLELKKKKKKVQELRTLLIKKERIELQKRLVEIVPMIIQLNLIAKEMRRDIEANIKIQYQFFGYHELTEYLKTSSYKSKLKLKVLIDNNEEGRSYLWSVEQFKNRLDLAKDMLEKYVQDPKNPILFDKEKDPFWDPCESELIGEGYLGMEHLLFQLDYYNPSLKIIGNQKIQGQLAVRIYPTSSGGTDNLAHQEEREREIFQSRMLLQKDLHFILNIDRLVIPDEFFDIKIVYEILEDNYKMVKYQTPKMEFAKQIHYLRKHTFRDISENTLLYMGDSHICFKVYGFRRIRQIQRSNVFTSQFEYEQEQDDKMSSTSSNISPNRQPSKISENTEYLDKLEKQYQEQMKLNEEKSKKEKESDKKGSGAKDLKKSSGKKDKKDDCLLF